MQLSTRFQYLVYLGSLLSIAILTVVGQTLIQLTLQIHTIDGSRINIAGRQRMLSQRLTLETYAMAYWSAQSGNQTAKINTLAGTKKTVLSLLVKSQNDLLYGNPELSLPIETNQTIIDRYSAVAPVFISIQSLSAQFDALDLKNPALNYTTDVNPILDSLLSARVSFLTQMNEMTNQYQYISDERIFGLITKEAIFLGISLFIFLAEMVFVVVPMAIHYRRKRKAAKKTEVDHSVVRSSTMETTTSSYM